MLIYRIADWSSRYENNRTRELKTLTWVPFPNSHDGDGYTALMSLKNAEALLGAFVVIVQVASKCDPRGTLLRSPAMPHTPASIARITRFTEKTIAECLKVCSDPEVGWIICEHTNEIELPAGECDNPAPPCDNPADGCASRARAQGREGKGMEGNNTLSLEEQIYEQYPRKVGKPSALKAIQKALLKTPFDDLLESTKRFASAYTGEMKYCPHPATWFNDERFDGDSLKDLENQPAKRFGRNGQELLTHFKDGTPVPVMKEEGSGHRTFEDGSEI